MSSKRIPATGYCPVQKKDNYTVYGNYISDGFGGYVLGTIYCPYKAFSQSCNENPCPIRSKLPKNI